MRTFTDFDEARGTVSFGETLCGTLLKDGTPVYFVMPVDVDEEQMNDASFEIREGRPRGGYERKLWQEAIELKARESANAG